MVILIIKIAVPILLILTAMITLMKTIKVGNEDLLAKAEETKTYNDYYAAVNALSKIKDETFRNDYNGRLSVLYEDIKAKMDAENDKEKPTGDGSSGNGGNLSGNGSLDVTGNSSSNGHSACKASSCNSTEPDPSAALNC